MSEPDRLDRLEQRLQRLEQLMRQVLQALPVREAAAPAAEPVEPPGAPPPVTPVKTPPSVTPTAPRLDGEQWVGQRGLLAVGVVAVILAAGYLLKLSFDRGWISPLMRCFGGGFVGVAVAGLGWGIDRRGYRTYGPALVGTGAAILYVTVWAASQLYGFLPPMTAILTMALVAVLLAGVAWVMDAEPLGSVAALGAFLAPTVIGNVDADADRLLAYLAAIGFALGVVAWSKRWRRTAFLIGLSYFGLGVLAADAARPFAALVFGAAGGAAGLGVGLTYDWWETRFLSFWGGWSCLALASSPTTAPFVLLAGAALSYPVWRHALGSDGTWPYERASEGRRPLLPSMYFYATPIWLVWAVDQLASPVLDRQQGLSTALVAAVYLAIGVMGGRRPFAVVGALGALVATLIQWPESLTAPGVLGILALAWGTIGRVTKRADWNYHALLPVGTALMLLWTATLGVRPPDSPAFIDGWALIGWGLLAVTIALATDLGAPEGDARSPRRGALWATAGAVLWLGVTGELTRFFRLNVSDSGAATLAGGLAVSVWWLLFAGGCILVGFRRTLRPLRLAGLWVSGLAVMKVLFVDLSTLDALYRVGSVFVLGLVSLLVAWAYHRRAKAEAPDVPAER